MDTRDKSPKISVVIPNWNGLEYLKVCLPSLMRQTLNNFEIIIIDNGSNDESVKYVKENYQEIVLVEQERNFGFCHAINTGIAKSRGEYIFLLNNDAEISSSCLAVLNAALDNNQEVYSCATRMLDFQNRTIINDAGDLFSIYGMAAQRGKGEIYGQPYDKEQYIFSACAGGAIYRKTLFDKIGLFDEKFFAYLEDVDIGFRAQLAGFKCLYVPGAIVYHLDGGTSKRINNFSAYYTIRNSLYTITKNFPMPLFFVYSPFLLIGQLRNIFFGIKNKRIKMILLIYFDFLKNFLRLIRQRKKIQKNRKASISYIREILSKKYPFSIKKSLLGLIKS